MCARIGDARQIKIFGAGEMAALLRAYAPQTWSMVSALVLDTPDFTQRLGLPVLKLGSGLVACGLVALS